MSTLVLSSSSIKQFKDCRKAYQINYEYMLNPNQSSEAAEDGSAFHRHIEWIAKNTPCQGCDDPMHPVASDYVRERPLPDGILGVEEPTYVRLLDDVWLRCTFDLIYRPRPGLVRGRDYKTFAAWNEPDVDLDFQGRLYTAVLHRLYPGEDVEFEYEYVRRARVGEVHNKQGGVWSASECYKQVPLIISQHEADQLWKETIWVAQDILRAREQGTFYRQDRKGQFNGCSGCFSRHICKSEVLLGSLDEQTVNLLATPREPLVLPSNYHVA